MLNYICPVLTPNRPRRTDLGGLGWFNENRLTNLALGSVPRGLFLFTVMKHLAITTKISEKQELHICIYADEVIFSTSDDMGGENLFSLPNQNAEKILSEALIILKAIRK